MRWSDQYGGDGLDRRQTDPNAHNVKVLTDAALAFAICFLAASFGGREVFAASLSSLLLFAAFLAAAKAQICAEPVNPNTLTNWDAAATFLLLSIALSWFVDPEAIRAYLEAHGRPAHGSPP